MEAQYYEQDEIFRDEHLADPHAFEIRIRTTAELVPRSIGSLLDVGAGDGRLTAALKSEREGVLLVAADRSVTGLRYVTVPKLLASSDALPFSKQSFDAVSACEVLEHLPVGIFERTCSELARVARTHVLITVPNNEKRRRADVRCPHCDCVFNRMRHLRSFTRERMAGLIPGFVLLDTLEFGPRPPVYPARARSLAERLDLIHRPSNPMCPQCGAGLGAGTDRVTAAPTSRDRPAGALRKTTYRAVRRALPKARRPYWLGAVYERRHA
jgi:SAM-dependent methyltransferase